MNKPRALEQEDKGLQQQATSRWLGVLTSAPPVDLPTFSCQLVAGEGRSKKLFLRHQVDSVPPLCAERAGCGVIFDGALYNRRDLERELGGLLASPAGSDAEIILAAYERWGEEFLKRLRGAFALIIWDTSREVLLCLRDPIGEDRDGLLVSPSIDVLIGQPNISASVNRAALADYLVDRFPLMEETFFDAVSRVPPGHVLRIARDDRRSYRYWDPAPGNKVNWLTPDEVERFDELLDQAVSRCLSLGPAGIFLSGGLDSVSVAAVAAHRAAADGISCVS